MDIPAEHNEIRKLKSDIEDQKQHFEYYSDAHKSIYDQISMAIDGDTGWWYPAQLVRAVEWVVDELRTKQNA